MSAVSKALSALMRSGSGPGCGQSLTALALLVFCLFTPLALAAPITYVQGHYETSLLPRAKMTVVYTEPQKGGDLNVVIVGWRDKDFPVRVAIVTDSKGNHFENFAGYAAAVGPIEFDDGALALSESIYFCQNIVSALPRANTVTVTFTGAASAPDVRILEYSGITSTTFPLFEASAQGGVSAWSRSGNLTIPSVPVLLVAANMAGPPTTGPTSGFTSRLLTKPYGDIAEDRVVTAFTSNNRFNAGATLSASGPWLMLMAIFKGE